MSSATRKAGWKRAAVRLGVFVAVGFFLTVGLAWGVSWSWRTTGAAAVGMSGVRGFPDGWIDQVPEGWPEEPMTSVYTGTQAVFGNTGWRGVWVRLRQGMGNGVSSGPAGVTFVGDQPEYVIDEIRVGWPIPTMRHLGPDDARGKGGVVSEGLGVPKFAALGLKEDRRLPVEPIWGWFAVSIVAWAVLFELVRLGVLLPGRVLRRRRRRQGRCVACGYELGELERCPECSSEREKSTAAVVRQ